MRAHGLLGVQTDAVVLHDEGGAMGMGVEHDGYAFGLSMLRDVVQSLLRDAVKSRVDLVGQDIWLYSACVQFRGNVEKFRPMLHVMCERCDQAEIVEHRRAQANDDPFKVAIQLSGNRFEGSELLPEISSPAAVAFQRREFERDCAQLLSELVVHLERNAAPFVFLRGGNTTMQLLPERL